MRTEQDLHFSAFLTESTECGLRGENFCKILDNQCSIGNFRLKPHHFQKFVADRPTHEQTMPVGEKLRPLFFKQKGGGNSQIIQRIAIKEGMSESQTVSTTIHEIAHAKLHDPATTGEEQRKNRSEREVEAESIAFVVCQYMGIDTSDYSFGYVAGWSADKELDELKASLELIRSTAKEVIAAIEEPEHSRELNKSLDHTKSEEVR